MCASELHTYFRCTRYLDSWSPYRQRLGLRARNANPRALTYPPPNPLISLSILNNEIVLLFISYLIQVYTVF